MKINVEDFKYRRASYGVINRCRAISLAKMSEDTGINISLLSRYEQGKVKPGMCNLIKIDNYLKSKGV